MDSKKEKLATRLFGFVDDERIEKSLNKVGLYCFGLLMIMDSIISLVGYFRGNNTWMYSGLIGTLLGCLIFSILQIKQGVFVAPDFKKIKKYHWPLFGFISGTFFFFFQINLENNEGDKIYVLLVTSIFHGLALYYFTPKLLNYFSKKSDANIQNKIDDLENDIEDFGKSDSNKGEGHEK